MPIALIPFIFLAIIFIAASYYDKRDKKKRRISLLKRITLNLGFDYQNINYELFKQLTKKDFAYPNAFLAQKSIHDLHIFIFEPFSFENPIPKTVVLFHHNKIQFSPNRLSLSKINDNCFYVSKENLSSENDLSKFINDAFHRYNIQSGRVSFYQITDTERISSLSLLSVPNNKIYSPENLLACLKSIVDKDKSLAAYYLSQFPNKEANPILLNILNSARDSIKIDIFKALAATGDKSLYSHLIPYLSHSRQKISKAAAQSLEALEWNPENNRERVSYLMALENWSQILFLGATIIPEIHQILSDKYHEKLKDYLEKIYHKTNRIIFGDSSQINHNSDTTICKTAIFTREMPDINYKAMPLTQIDIATDSYSLEHLDSFLIFVMNHLNTKYLKDYVRVEVHGDMNNLNLNSLNNLKRMFESVVSS